MQQSLSWEATRSSVSQEIPEILKNPKVHYRIHKHQQASQPTNQPTKELIKGKGLRFV
jgi:hypothetical protein